MEWLWFHFVHNLFDLPRLLCNKCLWIFRKCGNGHKSGSSSRTTLLREALSLCRSVVSSYVIEMRWVVVAATFIRVVSRSSSSSEKSDCTNIVKSCTGIQNSPRFWIRQRCLQTTIHYLNGESSNVHRKRLHVIMTSHNTFYDIYTYRQILV